MKTIFLSCLLLAATLSFAQINNGGSGSSGSGVSITTVSGLTALSTSPNGTLAIVTDGTSSSDCATGGGATNSLCQFDGVSSWTAAAIGLPSTPTSPNNVTQDLICSVVTGTCSPAWGMRGIATNAQTGVSYTIQASDRAKLITQSNVSASTYTATNPSTAGFGTGFVYDILNTGSSGALTETSSGFNVGTSTSLLIPPGWLARHWSDGVNYTVARFPTFGAFPACADTSGNHLNFTTAAGLSCGTSSSGGAGGIGGAPNYGTSFTGQTSITILGTAHTLNTKNLIVQCYDNSSPAKSIQPASYTVNGSTFDVVVNFGIAQTGYCTVNGTGPAFFASTFTSQTSLSVTGATHGLNTADLNVKIYDSATGTRTEIQPAAVTVDSTTFNVTVTFNASQSGRIVITD